MSMAGYTKLFNSILASTIWREDDKTRLVWITLLAMADKNGIAEGSVPGLADMARVEIPECEAALVKLMSPDRYSRTTEHEGKRIEKVEGGWAILNHAKYRAKMSADERKEYNRLKQRDWRAKHSSTRRQRKSITVNDSNSQSAMSAHTEADTDTKAEAESKEGKKARKARGSREDLVSYCISIGLPDSDGDCLFDKWEGNGWIVGGAAIKDWKAQIRNLKANGWLPSQKNPSTIRNGHSDSRPIAPAEPTDEAKRLAEEFAKRANRE